MCWIHEPSQNLDIGKEGREKVRVVERQGDPRSTTSERSADMSPMVLDKAGSSKEEQTSKHVDKVTALN